MRGGSNEERLYLFDSPEDDVNKTLMPNMDQLIARHKSRYHLAAFLARPGMNVLDFPCGSGYGRELLGDVYYDGKDNDWKTLRYGQRFYDGVFGMDDLTCPQLIKNYYDLILCIDGLEHIDTEYHEPLINAFSEALVPGGRLLVSTPEAQGDSGPSTSNPYHLWELEFDDFYDLLYTQFDDVQVIEYEDVLHNGVKTNCMYAIARRGND